VLGDIEWRPGVRGGAASLGDGCSLEIPAKDGPVLMGSGTVMFWVNPRWSMSKRRPGQVAFVRWMAGRSGVPHFGRLYKDNGGDNLTFDLTLAKNFYRCATPLTLQPGKWTHLALTWHIDQDAGAVEAALYRDGTPIAKTVRARTTAALRGMPPKIALGLTRCLVISRPGNYSMCAAIDELRLFAQVLSAAQVRECYRGDRVETE